MSSVYRQPESLRIVSQKSKNLKSKKGQLTSPPLKENKVQKKKKKLTVRLMENRKSVLI